APISPEAWKEIDATATQVLKTKLGGRKLVDFRGPLGWTKASVTLGRVAPIPPPEAGVIAAIRRVQPIVELTAEFELSRNEIDDMGRGAEDADLDPVIDAATRIAHAEDSAVFNGYEAAGIAGIGPSSTNAPLQISDDYGAYPGLVSEATSRLRTAGVDGPYAIALGPRCWAGLMQAVDG